MCVRPHRDVQALWSSEHALAWHLGDDFRADPVAWARTQCLKWEELEDGLPNFLEELPDCPCTLAQARADSGRFHVSPHPSQGPGMGKGATGASCPHHGYGYGRTHPEQHQGRQIEAPEMWDWGLRAPMGDGMGLVIASCCSADRLWL